MSANDGKGEALQAKAVRTGPEWIGKTCKIHRAGLFMVCSSARRFGGRMESGTSVNPQ
ncbi:hypothetical protein [Azospirillum largimobile]